MNAQEAQKHNISADVTAQGLVGYNLTYNWYGGLDVKGVLHADNVDFTLNIEALTKNVYSIGLTFCPSFQLCKNGYLFFDGTLFSRIYGISNNYEFIYAGSVGFRMRHFSVQAGLFSRTIDTWKRDWHSLYSPVTEPFNLLYKVKISVMGFDHPWDVFFVGANYNDYEYERMWEPMFSLGGRWDFKDRWQKHQRLSLAAALDFKHAGNGGRVCGIAAYSPQSVCGIKDYAAFLKNLDGLFNDICHSIDLLNRTPRFFHHRMSSQPMSMPPRWAKCATPSTQPTTPVNSSMAAKMITIHLALSVTGGKMSVILELGKSIAYPKSTP